ncbi:hypothetical protein R3P38DRAFT_3497021, partial [Favolaschia claudopus]
LHSVAPKDCKLPDNLRLLITSRPQHWADISGNNMLEHPVFQQHALDTRLSVDEVRSFIVARMKEITPKKPGWENWPPPEKLQELSNEANGLFHYAATALHWIAGRIDKEGISCQNEVWDMVTEEGGLDRLYKVILTSFEDIGKPTRNEQRRGTRLACFRHVMGTILILWEPLSISQINALLVDIPKEKFDVGHFLQQMRGVLIPGKTTGSFEDATPQMHKSFRDYIMRVQDPAEFRILTGHAHFVTARSCMEVIVKAGSQSRDAVNYAVGNWYKHLREAQENEGATWEDGEIWVLLAQMGGEAAISIWTRADLIGLFLDVANVGWRLLKRVRAFPRCPPRRSCSLFLASSPLESVCFPPSPTASVLLTFSRLVASSSCVLFP